MIMFFVHLETHFLITEQIEKQIGILVFFKNHRCIKFFLRYSLNHQMLKTLHFQLPKAITLIQNDFKIFIFIFLKGN